MKNLFVSEPPHNFRFTRLRAAVFLLITMAAKISVAHQSLAPDPAVIGRWDITIDKGGKSLPSWLEVQRSGNHTLIGRFVYAFGSARPISEVKVNNGKYSFSIPPQWEP